MASQWEQIKWIPGTKLMVDGFRYQNAGCKSYLLTHFHSDHTTGLNKSFTAGLIFCTPVTGRLLRKDMGMPAERICEIPMDKVTMIEGHEVIPIDANHCPGACMFLIRTKGTLFKGSQTILHTGDMRWNDGMASHPAVRAQPIDMLFMDTTYAKPTHTHPPQDFCIAKMVEAIQAERARNPRTLFVCGSYHIGKERAYLGAAQILGCKVWCDANKRRVLRMLDLPDELMILLTTKPQEALIHVDFLGALRPERLEKRIKDTPWTHAVGFRPTGWTYRRNGKLDCRKEGNVKIYGIPYSEHSSWPELRSCVTLLRPKKLIPTVNASNAALAEIIVNRFADCMDLSKDKSRLDFFMRKRQKVCHPACPLEPSVEPQIEEGPWAPQNETSSIASLQPSKAMPYATETASECPSCYLDNWGERGLGIHPAVQDDCELPYSFGASPSGESQQCHDTNGGAQELQMRDTKLEEPEARTNGARAGDWLEFSLGNSLARGALPCTPPSMHRSRSDESDKTSSPPELREWDLPLESSPLGAVRSPCSPLSSPQPSALGQLANRHGALCVGDQGAGVGLEFREELPEGAPIERQTEFNAKGTGQGFSRSWLKATQAAKKGPSVEEDSRPCGLAEQIRPAQLCKAEVAQMAPKAEGEPDGAEGKVDGFEGLVNLDSVSIAEQQRILELIETERVNHARQVTSSLARGRQASLAGIFKR